LRMPGDFDLQRSGAVGAQPLRQSVGHGGGLGRSSSSPSSSFAASPRCRTWRSFSSVRSALARPRAAARDESRPRRCGRW
jgi:hypothetical protein